MTALKTFLLGAMMTGAMAAPVAVMAQAANDAAPAPAVEKSADKPHFKRDGAKAFEESDTNKDGSLDLEEFLARHEEKFKEIDSNNDGKISAEEFKAHGDKMRDKMKEHREKRVEGKKPATETPADTGNKTAE